MSWELLGKAALRFNAKQEALEKIAEIAQRPEVLAAAPELKPYLEVVKTFRDAA